MEKHVKGEKGDRNGGALEDGGAAARIDRMNAEFDDWGVKFVSQGGQLQDWCARVCVCVCVPTTHI